MRSLLLLLLFAGACVRPGPARQDARLAPETRYFSPSARRRGIQLALEDRQAGTARVDRVAGLLAAELRAASTELLEEGALDYFRDAQRRERLVGEGEDTDLGRVARHFGADLVASGWVGKGNEDVHAWDVRLVSGEGVVVNRAAGISRGGAKGLFIAARRSFARLLSEDPVPVDGVLTRPDVEWAVRRRQGFFHACVAGVAMYRPTIEGRARVQLELDADGRVVSAEVQGSTFAHRDVDLCLERVGMGLRLPAGTGARVTIGYWVEPLSGPSP